MVAPNEHRQLAKGILTNTLGAAAKVSRALFLIAFSRMLGAELFGLYLLAFAIQEVVGKLASLGMEHGIMRLATHLRAQGRADEIRGSVERILMLAVVTSSLVALGLGLSADWISHVFVHKPALGSPLRNFCFGLPAVCSTSILLYAIRPTLDMRYEVYVRSLFEPLLILVLGVAAIRLGLGATGAVFAHNLAAFASLVLALFYFLRLHPQSGRKVPVRWKFLLNTSLPMGGMELLAMFKLRLDLLVIARIMPLASVGIYGAIVEIGNVLRKTRATFDPILMPMAQLLHEQKDRSRLKKNLALAIRWVMIPSFALLGPMLLIPEFFLQFFGVSFLDGRTALRIFSVGQLFVVTLGLLEGVLAVTGFAFVTLINSFVLVGANLVLLLWMVPRWGISGAALATTVSFIAVTVWRLLQSRKLLGLWPFERAQYKPLTAFALALAVAVPLTLRRQPLPLLSQLPCLALFLVTFAVALFGLKLEGHDKDVLRGIRSRIRSVWRGAD